MLLRLLRLQPEVGPEEFRQLLRRPAVDGKSGAGRRPLRAGSPAPETPNVPAPTLGATGATATITVESANCRAKPRGNAERITILYKGQEVEVLGKNDDALNPWWYVRIPDSKGNCWLWGMASKLNGSDREIPVVR